MGVFAGCILYGILVLQIWNYFQAYKHDGKWLKCFVFYLLVVETVETLIAMGVVFEPLIVENGKPQGTTVLPHLLPSQPIMAVLVSVPVQFFTAWRIFVITQNRIMSGVICIFSLASFGSSFYSTETTARARVIAKKSKLTHPYFLITATVTDILITASLIYSLSRRRSTTNKPFNLVLGKIMRLALQTGSITAAFTLTDAIAVYVSPKTAISFAFDFPVPKLYSNALLSTLNARSRLSRIVANDKMTEDQLSTFRAQARETGLIDEEEESDNPLFGRETYAYGIRREGTTAPSSSRFGQQTIQSNPIVFARSVDSDRIDKANNRSAPKLASSNSNSNSSFMQEIKVQTSQVEEEGASVKVREKDEGKGGEGGERVRGGEEEEEKVRGEGEDEGEVTVTLPTLKVSPAVACDE